MESSPARGGRLAIPVTPETAPGSRRCGILPEGVDFCDFACRVGPDPESATTAHVAEPIAFIDTAALKEWPAIHVEILAKAGHRTNKPASGAPADK